ncbi:methyl-accepting chemotaxis protein [Photobacterium sp. DNB23_23_1]
MKIRLILLFTVNLLAFGVIFIANSISLNQINDKASELYKDRVIPMGQLKVINDTFAVNIIDAFNKHHLGILSQQEMRSSIQSGLVAVDEQWSAYMNTYLTVEEQAIASRFERQKNVVERYLDRVMQSPMPASVIGELYQHVDRLSEIGVELTVIQESIAQALYQDSLSEAQSAKQLISIVMLLCLASSLYIIFIIYQFTDNYVGGEPQTISEKIVLISKGDLTTHPQGEEKGIYRDVLTMSANLNASFSEMSKIANNVASASEELAVVMQQAQQNANSELAQVESVSAAVEQLTSSAQEVTTQANQAHSITSAVISNVSIGDESLRQTESLNNQIEQSVSDSVTVVKQLKLFSNDIGDVVEVINAISEQTNLLALNAAIEAARAGSQGRGFAVVADEVRALAVKTQQSTLSIKEMIDKLQSHTQTTFLYMENNADLLIQSKALSKALSEAFSNISNSVDEMNQVSALVSQNAEEQAQVALSISENVTATVNTIHQNVAGISQSTAASEELSQLATDQKKLLTPFKLS